MLVPLRKFFCCKSMKKFILCLSFLLLVFFSTANIPSTWTPIDLHVGFVDPSESHVPIKRSPVEVPSLYLEGHNLWFDSSCNNCTLLLLNGEGDIEYSITIPDETTSISFPNYLNGEYEIQIIRGQFCFYGYVEL